MFRTKNLFDENLSADLAGKTLRGGAVSGAAQIVKFVINLGSLAILARLLSPGDFGLLAMAMVFLGFAIQMQDFGLSLATLQSRTITHIQVSTLFWLNVTISATIAGIIALLAPAIATFYENPALTKIVLVLCFGIFASGLGMQHIALLRRRMAFRAVAAVEVGGLLGGAVFGITSAFWGAGYWALVLMHVTQPVISTLIAFYCCHWLPGRPEISASTMTMVRFGGNLGLFNIVNYVTRNADNALIGRYVGDSALGVYSRAYGLLMLPLRHISAPIAQVTLPALSKLQDDSVEFRRYFLKTLEIISLLTMPTVVVLGVLADDIVLLVMGPQWGVAADLFQIFAVAAFFQAIPIAGSWTMIALGRSDRVLKWGTLQAIIAVPVFLVGLPWGAAGVAVAATIMSLVMMGPALAYALHGSPVTLKHALKAISIPLFFSMTLIVVLLAVNHMLDNMFYILRIGVICSVAIIQFVIACTLVPQLRRDFTYFISVVSRKAGAVK